MLEVLRPIFLPAFAILWLGGEVVLCVRFRTKRGTYLRRFPPLAGVPLGVHPGAYPGGHAWTHQADAELDRLRRAALRSYRDAALWAVGFPLLTLVLAALAIAGGLAQPR